MFFIFLIFFVVLIYFKKNQCLEKKYAFNNNYMRTTFENQLV